MHILGRIIFFKFNVEQTAFYFVFSAFLYFKKFLKRLYILKVINKVCCFNIYILFHIKLLCVLYILLWYDAGFQISISVNVDVEPKPMDERLNSLLFLSFYIYVQV